MKTLLKQSKLNEKLILNEDEDILLDKEENIGELNIFNTRDRIKELEAIKKERPLTDDELEELAYCKNEVDSRDAETNYLNGESLLKEDNKLFEYIFAFYKNRKDDEPSFHKTIKATSKNEAWNKAYDIAEETNTIVELIKDTEFPYLYDESLKEAKVDYVKTDTYGKYGTEVTIYYTDGDKYTKKGYSAEVNGRWEKADTLEELEKQIAAAVNGEDKKADNIILNDSFKESEEDDLLELEEPIDEEPTDTIEEPVEEVTQEVADNAYLTQLNDLITSEYGKIDNVKSLIATFTSEDAIDSNSEVIAILNAFIDETTISIGMLTKASELIDSTTSDLMKQGIEKAEDVIKNADKEEDKKEEE